MALVECEVPQLPLWYRVPCVEPDTGHCRLRRKDPCDTLGLWSIAPEHGMPSSVRSELHSPLAVYPKKKTNISYHDPKSIHPDITLVSPTDFRQVFRVVEWHENPLERRINIPIKPKPIVALSMCMYRGNMYPISSDGVSRGTGSVAFEIIHAKLLWAGTRAIKRPKIDDIRRVLRSCPKNVGLWSRGDIGITDVSKLRGLAAG